MASERVRTGTVTRVAAKLRAALSRDPERFAALGLLVDPGPADDYDPTETPETRADRETGAD